MTYTARIANLLGPGFGRPIQTGASVAEVVAAVVADFEAHGFVVVSNEIDVANDAADLFIAKPGTQIAHCIAVERAA